MHRVVFIYAKPVSQKASIYVIPFVAFLATGGKGDPYDAAGISEGYVECTANSMVPRNRIIPITRCH